VEHNIGRYPKYLDWLRYISAFLLMGYGASKLAHLQFHLNHALATRQVSSLTGYELTWFYYGYSRAYSIILGLTQIGGAALLLFRKTALFGALAMLPVIVNILLIDIFILPPDWGPTLPASIIFVSVVLILSRQMRQFVPLVWMAQIPEPVSSKRLQWVIRIAIMTSIFAMTLANVLLSKH
jgi:hypothetical protein